MRVPLRISVVGSPSRSSPTANTSRRRVVPILAELALFICFATGAAAQTQTLPAGEPQAKRPKVCLVLSGGGARGLGPIGVLRVLDELRVPIDCIAATSMGAIVGGLAATGMTPADMQERLAKVGRGGRFRRPHAPRQPAPPPTAT